jgi:hypothetical protein
VDKKSTLSQQQSGGLVQQDQFECHFVQTESNVKGASATTASQKSYTQAKTDQMLHQNTKHRAGKKGKNRLYEE